MEGLTKGDTPFEKMHDGRAKASLLLATHLAVKELVIQLDECDATIDQWKETVKMFNTGEATKDELEADLLLATQALKDQRLFESALIIVCEQAGKDLGMEA